MNTTDIVVGGDIVPLGANLQPFIAGDAPAIFHDLLPIFQNADLAVANLECPLIDRESPIEKTGPTLGATSACVRGLAASHIQCLGLANNHIRDHGSSGVLNTLRVCAENGLLTFGAGANLEDAGLFAIVNVRDLRIGLLGMAEEEWSLATPSRPGANPLDLIRYVRAVQSRRGDYDFLIVLLHGGVEHYPFPTPRLREVCRFLIEQGARLVVCQHSHCPGACEAYNGGCIVYGQGNLLFDSPDRSHIWHEGFLLRLAIAPDLSFDWQAIPFAQSQSGPGAKRMSAEREKEFLEELTRRSLAIRDERFVRRTWEQFCRERRHYVLSRVFGHGRILRRLNRSGRVVKHLHGMHRLRELRSYVMCDAHREVLVESVDQCLESE